MKSKACSICKDVKELSEFSTRYDVKNGYRSECKPCQWARQKRLRSKLHDRVKSAAKYGVEIGLIRKVTICSLCSGKGPLDKHHPDYKKPLKIVWLCRQCHSDVHKELRAMIRK